jgi:hypothetical protein
MIAFSYSYDRYGRDSAFALLGVSVGYRVWQYYYGVFW